MRAATSLLSLLALALLALAPAAAQVDCAATRAAWRVTSDGKAIDASLYDVNWVGSFVSVRSDGLSYVGTDQNYISATAFVQAALVTSIGSNPVNIPTILTYCPLNITAVNVTGSSTYTRYDIFWVVTTTTGVLPPTVLRVQCLSLARLPDTAGTKNLGSWQTAAGMCPSVTPCTTSAPCTPATYTAPLIAPPASGAGVATAAAVAAAAVAVAGALLV